jgi:hypothetical protein
MNALIVDLMEVFLFTWINISHLLFVDDILIFNGADLDHLCQLLCLFMF